MNFNMPNALYLCEISHYQETISSYSLLNMNAQLSWDPLRSTGIFYKIDKKKMCCMLYFLGPLTLFFLPFTVSLIMVYCAFVSNIESVYIQ